VGERQSSKIFAPNCRMIRFARRRPVAEELTSHGMGKARHEARVEARALFSEIDPRSCVRFKVLLKQMDREPHPTVQPTVRTVEGLTPPGNGPAIQARGELVTDHELRPAFARCAVARKVSRRGLRAKPLRPKPLRVVGFHLLRTLPVLLEGSDG